MNFHLQRIDRLVGFNTHLKSRHQQMFLWGIGQRVLTNIQHVKDREVYHKIVGTRSLGKNCLFMWRREKCDPPRRVQRHPDNGHFQQHCQWLLHIFWWRLGFWEGWGSMSKILFWRQHTSVMTCHSTQNSQALVACALGAIWVQTVCFKSSAKAA